MSSVAVGTHSGPLSLMSCVRESSPLQDYDIDSEKNVATKKRFWNPKKWFRRKNKAAEDVLPVDLVDKDVLRSRSTSELSVSDEQIKRKSGSSMHPGLSVSHDSVFHSPNSGSDIELDAAQSTSSLSASQPQLDIKLQTELSERLRLRRGRGDTSEDDEGLPHSPCNSPTTTEAPADKTAIKDLPSKSQSTCSDGSFLSMGSSEMDEESFSQHSSRISLHEKQDSDLELGPSASTVPLNHSAARHRVAVRPKRRAPHRNKKVPQISTALPTTLEVNEEFSFKSATPENITKEAVTELYSTKTTLTETQIKCSSLPPGLAPPGGEANKLNRSQSNAGNKSQDPFATLEEDAEKEEKVDKSFFDRIFPRRSAKKRKSKEEKQTREEKIMREEKIESYSKTVETFSKRVESKPMAAPRSGAASRQRIQPIDLPASPELIKREIEVEKSFPSTSPLQAELESRFKQRHTPPQSPLESRFKQRHTPPQSPKVFKASVISTQNKEVRRESRNEELRSKIPALSSLQQRVLSLNDEVDEGFKSLTNLEVKPLKIVTKSHSFKSSKQEQTENFNIKEEKRNSVAKAISLDSVKHLDEPKLEEDVVKPVDRENFTDDVIISGPCHTSVVNVSNSTVDSYSLANTKTDESGKVTKEAVSVTKIHLKKEITQFSQSTVTVPKSSVPEFINKQLNKVETRPSSNVVFSMNSPRIIEEKPKTIVSEEQTPRKFSREDVEIVDKSDEVITIPPQPRFKKNENVRKTSEELPRSRSISLDSLKSDVEASDKSSQDSIDKLEEKTETVVLRKKSLAKQKNEDEPELMKVFARRSLKLKDSDSEIVSQQVTSMLSEPETKTRDSDKENQLDSPVERKKSASKKEPLTESKVTETVGEEKNFVETTEVTLRKPVANSFFSYQRAVSVNTPVRQESTVTKQTSFHERRRTDNWIKSGDVIEKKNSQDEIITEISKDFINEEVLNETKNFNQRKAEWEKRAQEAQKKTVP